MQTNLSAGGFYLHIVLELRGLVWLHKLYNRGQNTFKSQPKRGAWVWLTGAKKKAKKQLKTQLVHVGRSHDF